MAESKNTWPASRGAQNWIALALVAFFAGFGILSVQKVSVTIDEPRHFQYGLDILDLNSDRKNDDSKMPVSALNALPAKIASGLPDGPVKVALNDVFAGRLMTILFSALVATMVFHWARALYGFYAGLAALFLYIFDPNIIAHSQLITTDIYVTGLILFACYWTWKFAGSRRWLDGCLAACMIGLSQLTKYTSIALLPLLFLALALHDLPAQITAFKEHGMAAIGKYLGRLILFVAATGLATLLLVNLGFVFNRTFLPLKNYDFESSLFQRLQNVRLIQNLPIPFPYPYLQGLDRVVYNERTGTGYGNIYLLGQIHSGQGFPGYYFIASALKVPIATQLVLAVSLIVYLADRRRREGFLQNEIFIALPVIFYAVYFNFFYNAQLGIRYYLVIFPLLYVFAGGLFQSWPTLSRKWKWATLALAAYLVASVLSYYPFYLSYFNELVWDRRYAYRYLSDSNLDWRQGKYYLVDYMAAHPAAIYSPVKPTSGELIVRINDLTGVSTNISPDTYAWLRDNFQPAGTIAYAYLIYEISPQQIQQLCATQGICP